MRARGVGAVGTLASSASVAVRSRDGRVDAGVELVRQLGVVRAGRVRAVVGAGKAGASSSVRVSVASSQAGGVGVASSQARRVSVGAGQTAGRAVRVSVAASQAGA